MTKPIFLIGYMGSGKSTLGLTTSRMLNRQFIDLDVYIENRYHSSINDLFNSRGEAAYRIIEKNMLHEVADFDNVIISCGGGTPLHFDNMEFMNTVGVTVWLNAAVSVLISRLSIPSAKAKRPLLSPLTLDQMKQFIVESVEKRIPIYSKAQIEFDASALDNRHQIAEATQKLCDIITASV